MNNPPIDHIRKAGQDAIIPASSKLPVLCHMTRNTTSGSANKETPVLIILVPGG